MGNEPFGLPSQTVGPEDTPPPKTKTIWGCEKYGGQHDLVSQIENKQKLGLEDTPDRWALGFRAQGSRGRPVLRARLVPVLCDAAT